MLFVSRIAVLANTPASAPVFGVIETPLPWIKELLLIFEGNKVDMGCRLLNRASLMFPTVGSSEIWIRHNGAPIRLNEPRYELKGSPFEIRIEAYNTTGGNLDLDVYVTCEAWETQERLIDEIKGLRKDLNRILEIPAEQEKAAA